MPEPATQLPALHAAVLIGGASRRMGSPKHLLVREGRTLLERTAELLEAVVGRVVIVGAGELPPACPRYPRLADSPIATGPIAGLLAMFDSSPDVAWLAAATDLPRLSQAALQWLLSQRSTAFAAIQPRTADGQVHPLLAVYEPAAAAALRQVAHKHAPLREIAQFAPTARPQPPQTIEQAWINANTPDEWRRVAGGAER